MARECPYKLLERLSCLELPAEGAEVTCADDLLRELVANSDSKGRYMSHAFLLRRLCWWQDISIESLRAWREELVERGEIEIQPLGRSSYTGDIVDVIVICNPRRFDRFAPRAKIPEERRIEIFERDGYQCVWCGSAERPTLDHIVPVSKGGGDEIDNLQLLCQSCNSRKHNKNDSVAKAEIMVRAA